MKCCQCQFWKRCRCYNERHADDKKLVRLYRKIGSLNRSADDPFCKHGLRIGEKKSHVKPARDYKQAELFTG